MPQCLLFAQDIQYQREREREGGEVQCNSCATIFMQMNELNAIQSEGDFYCEQRTADKLRRHIKLTLASDICFNLV